MLLINVTTTLGALRPAQRRYRVAPWGRTFSLSPVSPLYFFWSGCESVFLVKATTQHTGAWHRESCARAHACEVHTCRRPSVGLGPRDRAPDHATRRLPCRAHAGGRANRVLALAACVSNNLTALSLHNLGEQYARYILFFYSGTLQCKLPKYFVTCPASVYLS